MCMQACIGQRSVSGVFLGSPYFFEIVSHLWLDWRASEPSGIHLSPLAQIRGSGHMLGFLWGF